MIRRGIRRLLRRSKVCHYKYFGKIDNSTHALKQKGSHWPIGFKAEVDEKGEEAETTTTKRSILANCCAWRPCRMSLMAATPSVAS